MKWASGETTGIFGFIDNFINLDEKLIDSIGKATKFYFVP